MSSITIVMKKDEAISCKRVPKEMILCFTDADLLSGDNVAWASLEDSLSSYPDDSPIPYMAGIVVLDMDRKKMYSAQSYASLKYIDINLLALSSMRDYLPDIKLAKKAWDKGCLKIMIDDENSQSVADLFETWESFVEYCKYRALSKDSIHEKEWDGLSTRPLHACIRLDIEGFEIKEFGGDAESFSLAALEMYRDGCLNILDTDHIARGWDGYWESLYSMSKSSDNPSCLVSKSIAQDEARKLSSTMNEELYASRVRKKI